MGAKTTKLTFLTKTPGISEVEKLGRTIGELGKIDTFRKLTADAKDSMKSWKAAEKEVRRLSGEMKKAEKPTLAMRREFEKSKKAASKLKKEYESTRKRITGLRKSMAGSGIDTRHLVSEQKRLTTALKAVRREAGRATKIDMARGLLAVRPHREIQREIKRTRLAYQRLKKSGLLTSRELMQAKRKLNVQVRELRTETSAWGASINKTHLALIGLAAAGYVAKRSFGFFADFSSSMAKVNTMLDITPKRFKALSDEISKMSSRLPQTAEELAAAEYDILSAGAALDDSTKILELAGKAAMAGITDVQTAANIGLGVINAYGKDIDELGNVYDILFTTVKSGVTTFPELATTIGAVLPSARAAGVDFEEVASAIASMTKAGIKTPRAAIALKGAINAMAAPTAEAKKQFSALGITWQGLIPTLKAIEEKNLSIDKMRLLIPDVEARTGVQALTQNLDGLHDVLDKSKSAAGEMKIAFDKISEGDPYVGLHKLWNNIKRLGTGVGSFVAKPLKWAVGGLNGLFDSSEHAGQGLDNLEKSVSHMAHGMQAAADTTAAAISRQKELISDYRHLIQTGILALSEKTKASTINAQTETNNIKLALDAERKALAERKRIWSEETSIKQAELDKQAAGLDLLVAKGVISSAEAAFQKAKIEKEFTAAKLVELESQLASAKSIYSQESAEYKNLLRDKLVAEAALIRNDTALVDAKTRLTESIEKSTDATRIETDALAENSSQTANTTTIIDDHTTAVEKNAKAQKQSAEAAAKTAEANASAGGWLATYVSYWEKGQGSLGQLNTELKKYGDLLTLYSTTKGAELVKYSWQKTLDSLVKYKEEFNQVVDQAGKYGLQLDFNNDTLDTAIQKVQTLKDEYMTLTRRIESMQRGLDDQLRSLSRRGMTDKEKQADIQRQYYERLAEAQQAANEGNYDMALNLYNQAKTLAGQLATEVKNVAGETISTLETNTVKAARLMKKAGEEAIKVLKKMRQQLGFNANPETLQLPSFGRGGPIYGRPHSRGGTLIEAERGEFIHPVRAVNYYGKEVMEALRRRIIDPAALRRLVFGRSGKLNIPAPRFDMGGMVNLSPRSAGNYAADGGMVTDVVELRISSGGNRASVRGDRENVEGMLRMLKQFRARARG